MQMLSFTIQHLPRNIKQFNAFLQRFSFSSSHLINRAGYHIVLNGLLQGDKRGGESRDADTNALVLVRILYDK